MINTKLVETIRKNWEGVSYKRNGRDKRGVDCVGLIHGIYGDLNTPLPGKKVDKHEDGAINYLLQLGRAVFRKVEKPAFGDILILRFNGIGLLHCGVYLDDNLFIHAMPRKKVRVENFQKYAPQIEFIWRVKGGLKCPQL